MGEQSLREQVAWASRILATEGYADLTLGHVSARGDDGRVYIKRKGVALDEVEPDDIVEFSVDDADSVFAPDMHLEAVLHQVCTSPARCREAGSCTGIRPTALRSARPTHPSRCSRTTPCSFADGAPGSRARRVGPRRRSGRSLSRRSDLTEPSLLCNHGVLGDREGRTVGHVARRRSSARPGSRRSRAPFGSLRPIPVDRRWPCTPVAQLPRRLRPGALYAWLRKLGRVGRTHGCAREPRAACERRDGRARRAGRGTAAGIPAQPLRPDRRQSARATSRCAAPARCCSTGNR